jgi:hypothetical protein
MSAIRNADEYPGNCGSIPYGVVITDGSVWQNGFVGPNAREWRGMIRTVFLPMKEPGIEDHGRTRGDREMMKDPAETMNMLENEENEELSMEGYPNRRTPSMLRALTRRKIASQICASN